MSYSALNMLQHKMAHSFDDDLVSWLQGHVVNEGFERGCSYESIRHLPHIQTKDEKLWAGVSNDANSRGNSARIVPDTVVNSNGMPLASCVLHTSERFTTLEGVSQQSEHPQLGNNDGTSFPQKPYCFINEHDRQETSIPVSSRQDASMYHLTSSVYPSSILHSHKKNVKQFDGNKNLCTHPYNEAATNRNCTEIQEAATCIEMASSLNDDIDEDVIEVPQVIPSYSGASQSSAEMSPNHISSMSKQNNAGDLDCHSKNAECESVETSQPQKRPASKRNRVAESHNLSEKRRRNRINEKLKSLQELIPNSSKTDKASILDEAIEYLKSLQSQLQIMSARNSIRMSPLIIPSSVPNMPMAQLASVHPFMGLPFMQTGINLGSSMGMIDQLQNIVGQSIPGLNTHFAMPVAPQKCTTGTNASSSDICGLGQAPTQNAYTESDMAHQGLHQQGRMMF